MDSEFHMSSPKVLTQGFELIVYWSLLCFEEDLHTSRVMC